MTGERFADFDTAFAARSHGRAADRRVEPVTIRLYGDRWDLGYSLPAAAALRIARIARDGQLRDLDLKDPAIVAEAMTLAGEMIPAPVLKEWMARGIDIDDLSEIVLWLLGQFLHGDADSGEAAAPETGASTSPATSSSTGLSSSPTSNGSTSSTSSTEEPSTA